MPYQSRIKILVTNYILRIKISYPNYMHKIGAKNVSPIACIKEIRVI